ncbi:thymidine kinase [Litorivicinus lipolyticus]|uniref:Thymidine kinase n=1 Tax=Litorivicinus lipolyticus TaxID=418701 RepID=A0A5Q2QCY0_9GAMM|nr:thymidine kinase [Litorivicinus lipolyticus]QGG81163.1 thymidine kinase [Litorivicinus lipolyticus]
MAKLYFSYSAMNAGKSTLLLQASHNYRERGMPTLLLTASFDDRAGVGRIGSRIGLNDSAYAFHTHDDLFEKVSALHQTHALACVFVDEAQFLTAVQVWQLARVCDVLKLPVMCYGLRTDFQGKLFPGSAELLAVADTLREIRTICWCGSKATMVIRMGADGEPVDEGAQVEIGGNDKYVSLCRAHWLARDVGRAKPFAKGLAQDDLLPL